ncbi:phospholipase D-like domain-containing protein [Alkalicoccus saliphilus]|nr:phospholipase D family protein [Alkalicoccus saliphilus]
MWKKILAAGTALAGIFLIYLWIGGALILQLTVPVAEETSDRAGTERFYSQELSSDRVALIHERVESKKMRTHLKETADESLDVTMFKITDGTADLLFYTSLLEAADRGVHVRVLVDGMFHNLRGDKSDIAEAFMYHPNIELKFFEPVNLWKPWSLNNRLHDKLIIADDRFGMISGRNIGDRYFAPTGFDGATDDRDAVVYNPSGASYENSGVFQMQDYFNLVWNHEYAQEAVPEMSGTQRETAEDRLQELRRQYAQFQEEYGLLYNNDYEWENSTYEVNNVTFVHNPLGRMNKDPWVWKDLIGLMEEAEESVIMQSSFIIPSDTLTNHINAENLPADVQMITNSLAATPNLPTFSRYASYREDLAASQADVYEYQETRKSIHGKSYVFDNRLSAIGSFNLDPRSVHLSTESMLVIDSEDVNKELRAEKVLLIHEESLRVKEDGSYEDNDNVEKEEPPVTREAGRRIWTAITFFFEHLF